MGTDICLPVARYSHAVGLHADGTVSWTHINSSSLFIILKGTDKDATRLDDKLMLRIVQANDVLVRSAALLSCQLILTKPRKALTSEATSTPPHIFGAVYRTRSQRSVSISFQYSASPKMQSSVFAIL